MSEEERQRQMDFILNQRAQFAAGMRKLHKSQAETMQLVNHLAAVMREGRKRFATKMKALFDAQKRTDEALAKLRKRRRK